MATAPGRGRLDAGRSRSLANPVTKKKPTCCRPRGGGRCGEDSRLFRGLGLVAAGASALWLLPGLMSLALFALLLTRIDTAFAGRAYAAYGGIYVVMSLFWLWLVEGRLPDRWDRLGFAVILAGSAVIMLGPRANG